MTTQRESRTSRITRSVRITILAASTSMTTGCPGGLPTPGQTAGGPLGAVTQAATQAVARTNPVASTLNGVFNPAAPGVVATPAPGVVPTPPPRPTPTPTGARSEVAVSAELARQGRIQDERFQPAPTPAPTPEPTPFRSDQVTNLDVG